MNGNVYTGLVFLAVIIGIVVTFALPVGPTCADHYRAWDRLQYNIADCREDPDCYITTRDLEQVRELAPHVAACELREDEE